MTKTFFTSVPQSRSSRWRPWIAVLFCFFQAIGLRITTSVPLVHASPMTEQTSSPPSPYAAWTTFSAGDGLASDSILSLSKSDDGLLWIGTNNGLNLLTLANEWQTVTDATVLNGNITFDITMDPHRANHYWIATDKGATLLDTNGTPLLPDAYNWVSFSETDGLVNDSLSTVAVDAEGNIWMGTDFIHDDGTETGYGLARLDINGTPFVKGDDQWTTFTAINSNLPHDVIRDIVVNQADETIWVGTKGGIAVWDEDDWIRFTTIDGLASNDVRSLLPSKNGLWIGTTDGLSHLSHNGTLADKSDDEWHTITTRNSSLIHDAIKSLAMDEAGRLWIGSVELGNAGEVGHGLSIWAHNDTLFNAADDSWIRYSTTDGLSDNAVRTILPVSNPEVSNPEVSNPVDQSNDPNHVWLGTKGGLTKLTYNSSPFVPSDNQWTKIAADARLPNNTVNAVVANQKAAWWGTEGGLAVQIFNHTPHTKGDDQWMVYTIEDGLPSNQILALALGPQNRLWIGTAAGLVILDDAGSPSITSDDRQMTYTTVDGLLTNKVSDIQFDSQGRVWIASGDYVNGGIYVLDIGTNWLSEADDTWAVFTDGNSGIPAGRINALAIGPTGIIWGATNKGVVRINHGGTPFELSDDVVDHFDMENSPLAFDIVRDVAVDGQGNPWFGLAAGGINLLANDDSWHNFTESDGLVFNSVSALAFDQQNNLWIGTEGAGISLLDFANTHTNKEDDQWRTYAERTYLLSGTVRNVYTDALNQSWIGTYGGGGSLYSTFSWNTIYLPNILNTTVTK